MKKLVLSTVIAASCAFAAPASYNSCVGCHGANGEKNTMVADKIPANLTKAQIVESLNGYKAKTIKGGKAYMMYGIAGQLDDAKIKEIAEFIGK